MIGLRLCDYAAAELRRIGFQLFYTSMRSESCYYWMLHDNGVIRVAAHTGGRTDARTFGKPILARLTFGPEFKPDTLDEVDHRIAWAVGRYMLTRTLPDRPSN